jgi:hypothetical protein
MNGFPHIYVVNVEPGLQSVRQSSDRLLKYDLAAKSYKSKQNN